MSEDSRDDNTPHEMVRVSICGVETFIPVERYKAVMLLASAPYGTVRHAVEDGYARRGCGCDKCVFWRKYLKQSEKARLSELGSNK